MMKTAMSANATSDAELVNDSLAGDRDAFGQIVARYQSLICSLAYSATGSLSQSEDLAQETFVTAWQQLRDLREPEKLRSWLCRIARNLAYDALRAHGREPSHRGEALEEISETHSPEPQPHDHTISSEEQAILWRSLARIPEIYREPLVLFYREHQSIEAVAEKLELTEDNVKQRLSRGRKLLHEEVLAFVEGALAKTNPGKAFTLGVLASLPLATASAKAATLGVGITTGGVAAKSALTVGTVGGFFAMLGGAFVTFKALIDDSKSPRERQFMLQNYGKRMCFGVILMVAAIIFLRLDYFHSPLHLSWFAAVVGFLTAVYSTVVIPRRVNQRRRIQIEDGTFDAAEWIAPRKLTEAKAGEKNSRLKFMAFGICLAVYVLWQQPWKTDPTHAILWLAFFVFTIIRGFHRWDSSPRFHDLRGFILFVPVFFGLVTLTVFNWHQYLAHFGINTSRSISNREAVAFNLVVTLAYAALFAIQFLKRKAEVQAASQKQPQSEPRV